MGFEERSYSGHLVRPRPEIHFEEDQQLLIVTTPWGPRSSAKKVNQIITDHLLSSRSDMESTSPFAKLTCLSPLANDLRVAIKLANDALYSEDNKNEYLSAVELSVIARSGRELCWAQIGYPYMFLDRHNFLLKPLGNSLDLSSEMSPPDYTLPPLPQTLLGLDSSSDFAVHSYKPQKQDQLVLVSRSSLPIEFYQLKKEQRNIDDIARAFSAEDSEAPFWLGIYSL